jgi:hypothetical protein
MVTVWVALGPVVKVEVPLGSGVSVIVLERVPEAVIVAVGVRVSVKVTVSKKVGEAVRLGEAVGVTVLLGVAVREGDAVTVSLAVRVAVRVLVLVGQTPSLCSTMLSMYRLPVLRLVPPWLLSTICRSLMSSVASNWVARAPKVRMNSK